MCVARLVLYRSTKLSAPRHASQQTRPRSRETQSPCSQPSAHAHNLQAELLERCAVPWCQLTVTVGCRAQGLGLWNGGDPGLRNSAWSLFLFDVLVPQLRSLQGVGTCDNYVTGGLCNQLRHL